jgi:hypothetical protein
MNMAGGTPPKKQKPKDNTPINLPGRGAPPVTPKSTGPKKRKFPTIQGVAKAIRKRKGYLDSISDNL